MVDLTELLDKVYTRWDIFDFENVKNEKMTSLHRFATAVGKSGIATIHSHVGVTAANMSALFGTVEQNTTPYIKTSRRWLFEKEQYLVLPYFQRRFELTKSNYNDKTGELTLHITKLKRRSYMDLSELRETSPGVYEYKVPHHIREAAGVRIKLPNEVSKVRVEMSYAPDCWT